MAVTFEPIGVLHTCFKEKFGIPRQMNLVKAASATLEFFPEFAREEAIRELDGFSHIWLLFLFHQAKKDRWPLMVRPPRLGGNKKVGVFASRSPFRPNPIGMSAVRLVSVETTDRGPMLHLKGVDILDGTPVLDIKPYLPYADRIRDAAGGFAPGPPDSGLVVEFSQKALAQCREKEREVPELAAVITGVLENDPRPGYRNGAGADDQKIYGTRLFDLDVKWTVSDRVVRVMSLDPT